MSPAALFSFGQMKCLQAATHCSLCETHGHTSTLTHAYTPISNIHAHIGGQTHNRKGVTWVAKKHVSKVCQAYLMGQRVFKSILFCIVSGLPRVAKCKITHTWYSEHLKYRDRDGGESLHHQGSPLAAGVMGSCSISRVKVVASNLTLPAFWDTEWGMDH